jgi:hypothetical protein
MEMRSHFKHFQDKNNKVLSRRGETQYTASYPSVTRGQQRETIIDECPRMVKAEIVRG